MTTTTPFHALSGTAWTEIASGTSFAEVTLQLRSSNSCAIAVRPAVPATIDLGTFLDYFTLWQGGDRSATFKLATADKVFALGMSNAAAGLATIKVSV